MKSMVLARTRIAIPLVAVLFCSASPSAARDVASSHDTSATMRGSRSTTPGAAASDVVAERPLRRETSVRGARAQLSSERESISNEFAPLDYGTPLFGELQQARLEYGYLCRALALIEEQRSLLQSFADTAEERFKAAVGSQHDVLTAQLEVMKLTARQAEYEKRLHLAKSRTNRLLSKPSETAIDPISSDGEPLELSYTLEEIYKLAQRSSGSNELSGPGEHPRPAGHGEQDADSSSLYLHLEQAYLEASTSWRLIQLYRTNIIPLAGVALESAFGSYQAGKTDFTQLLETALTVYDAQLDSCRYAADYQTAVAQLEFLAGAKLTRSKEVASASR